MSKLEWLISGPEGCVDTFKLNCGVSRLVWLDDNCCHAERGKELCLTMSIREFNEYDSILVVNEISTYISTNVFLYRNRSWDSFRVLVKEAIGCDPYLFQTIPSYTFLPF